jgi:phosphatidylserine decarboxylase
MIKHKIDLANICHKLNINPFHVVLISGILIIFGIPLILINLNVSSYYIVIIWIMILLFSALIFLLYFQRDPERESPKSENVIVSPADGKIVYIKNFKKGEMPFSIKGKNTLKINELSKCDEFKDNDGCIIGVEMRLFDVHVNRAPINGVIKLSKHNQGKFIRQTEKEFEIMNESHTIIIEHMNGYMIGIVQIATFLVRGIECYVKEGDLVKLGERVGRIKFGSQVDIIIPFTMIKLIVKEGDRVYAGESILVEVTKC